MRGEGGCSAGIFSMRGSGGGGGAGGGWGGGGSVAVGGRGGRKLCGRAGGVGAAEGLGKLVQGAGRCGVLVRRLFAL